MAQEDIAGGTAHKLTPELRKALVAAPKALAAWQSLTPLARNEWICWTTNPKQLETRKNHVKRTVSELQEGKRRPCCWMGCIHRTDKAISPSVQWVLKRQKD
jgi:uncharacterized protein YdeI (YjbR/CyaY-like superfamily)